MVETSSREHQHPPHPTKLSAKRSGQTKKMKRGNKKFRPTQAKNAGKQTKKGKERRSRLRKRTNTPAKAGHPEREKQIPLLRTTGRQFFLNSEMRKSAKWIIIFTNLEAHLLGRNLPTLRFSWGELTSYTHITVLWNTTCGPDLNHDKLLDGVNFHEIIFDQSLQYKFAGWSVIWLLPGSLTLVGFPPISSATCGISLPEDFPPFFSEKRWCHY